MRGGSQPASRQAPSEWLCIPKVEEGLGEECPPPPLIPRDSLGPERITHLSAARSKVEDKGDLMGWGGGWAFRMREKEARLPVPHPQAQDVGV